jgi:uncharacterized protein
VSKIFLFLIIAVVVYWWLRKQRNLPRPDNSDRRNRAETMVSCAYCGLHVPLSESVSGDDRYYCGDEHRRLHGGVPRA